jgi:sugar lactone lactonase YvrE
LAFSPNGDLYVSEGLSAIYRFDKSGYGTLFANLASPGGMAFDQSGNLYVTSNNTIVRFDASRTATVVVSSGLSAPVDLAFDSRGDLFISNSQTHTIVKITPGGVQSVFAGPSEGLSVPLGLAFDSDDFLYVVNYIGNSVVKLDPDGKARPFATEGLNRPRFIAVRPTPLFGGKITRIAASQYRITFQGDPGRPYVIQYRSNLIGEEPWQFLVTRLADSRGRCSTVDQPLPGTRARFYRAIASNFISKSMGTPIR